jgi:hypothetical protein
MHTHFLKLSLLILACRYPFRLPPDDESCIDSALGDIEIGLAVLGELT